MTADYELGERVRFTHQLRRRTEYRDRADLARDRWKVWTPEHAPHGRHGGVIVGRRTLANGVTSWEHEAGEVWHSEGAEHFRAYIVAWHLDKRPALVLPEHLEPLVQHPTVTVPRPHVPHGPAGISADLADADYLRTAAERIGQQRWFGSNLSATLAGHLHAVADVIYPLEVDTPLEGIR